MSEEDASTKIIDFDKVRLHALCVGLLTRYAGIPEKAFGKGSSASKTAAEALVTKMRSELETIIRASLSGAENPAFTIPHSSEGENSED